MLNKLKILTLLVATVSASSLLAETFRVPATAETVTLGLFTLKQNLS